MFDRTRVSLVSLVFFVVFIPAVFAGRTSHATVVVKGAIEIAETDNNFICATIDWWPPEKCDYKQCPWGNSTVLTLDLSHPLLAKAIKAFNHLRIRIGGTLQDKVIYEVGNINSPCLPFKKIENELLGFSMGCLQMSRWDDLNDLLNKTGAIVTFGLNALNGRRETRRGVWEGPWDTTNARDFMNYTISKGYQIDSWELGNELSGKGIGASVGATEYGLDLINLKAIIDDLYNNSHRKPLILAPGGFFDREWFAKFLEVSGPNVLDAITHHIYNLGPGSDPRVFDNILDPGVLSGIAGTFNNVKETIQRHGPWAAAWVGEAGGAYNSGGRDISNTFVNSFWYLDQLGMSSKYKTTVYCRQSLIGGNYGLLDTTSFVPNPDYYSALLWSRLMGKKVLDVQSDASPFLRVYAHCSKGKKGITLLMINLSTRAGFSTRVLSNLHLMDLGDQGRKESSFTRVLKKAVSWVGRRTSDERVTREEYHLTPLNGNLRSRTMLLNESPLELTETGDIPKLNPILVDIKSPVYIAPLSMAFIAFPEFDAPACV